MFNVADKFCERIYVTGNDRNVICVISFYERKVAFVKQNKQNKQTNKTKHSSDCMTMKGNPKDVPFFNCIFDTWVLLGFVLLDL